MKTRTKTSKAPGPVCVGVDLPAVTPPYIAGQLLGLVRPIDGIRFDPKNARAHNDRNLAAIRASLERFGQTKPIVLDQDGVVVAGNGTLKAALSLGWTCIAAVSRTFTVEERAAYAVADNRTAELATWDEANLAELLGAMPAADLAVAGFTQDELNALVAGLKPAAPERDDAPAPLKDTATAVGDLWILGPHRLLCGDSTKLSDVQRLMNGEPAALVATDPPYLVDYTGSRPEVGGGNTGGKDWSADYREIDIKDADGFFRSVFTNVLAVMAPKAAVYCWHAHKRQHTIAQVWAELGILDHQQIIWVKPTAVYGRVFWHFRHEPCMMGWRQGSMPEYDDDHTMNSVWEIDWEGKKRIVGNEHPTQKPVEIFARPMRKHTKVGALCFEPFSGSGSCIVAGETESRRVYAMELSPVFVDVAVRRWQKLTGKDATLHGSATKWNERAKERGLKVESE